MSAQDESGNEETSDNIQEEQTQKNTDDKTVSDENRGPEHTNKAEEKQKMMETRLSPLAAFLLPKSENFFAVLRADEQVKTLQQRLSSTPPEILNDGTHTVHTKAVYAIHSMHTSTHIQLTNSHSTQHNWNEIHSRYLLSCFVQSGASSHLTR